MSGRIGGVVGQAIKVAAVVTGVLAVDPWVEQVFPDLPAAARYAASALPEAVLVEVLAQLVFGWPRIAVRWSEHSDSTPVSSVTLRASRRTMTAQSMDVTIHAATSGTVGHWLFRRWMRDDVILRFMADEAPIRPTVERSSKRNDIASVRPVDQTRGFDAVLGVAPRRPGTWHDAEVRWAVVDFPAPDTEFNFDHRLVVPGRPIRTWLLKCIRVSTSADTIRIVRK